MRAVVAAVLVLLLAGCESTRFTALPWATGGATCDDPPAGWWTSFDPQEAPTHSGLPPAMDGRPANPARERLMRRSRVRTGAGLGVGWQVQDGLVQTVANDRKDQIWVYIGDDCFVAVTNQQAREAGLRESKVYTFAASYGIVDSRGILAVHDRDVMASATELADTAGGEAARQGEDGWFLLEVVPERDSLRIRSVNHRRLAHAIIDEKVRGSVLRTANTLANEVTEDAEGVRALLADEATFGDVHPVRLDRVDPRKIPDEVAKRLRAAVDGRR